MNSNNTVFVLIGSESYGDSHLIGVYDSSESAESAKRRLEESNREPTAIPDDQTALDDDHDWPDNLVMEHGGSDHPIAYHRYQIKEETVR